MVDGEFEIEKYARRKKERFSWDALTRAGRRYLYAVRIEGGK
jgi:hypothetical protein